MTSLFQKLEAMIKSECQTLQALLAKIEAELKPVVEQDLQIIISAGLAAGAAAVTGGQSITLDAIETAAVVAGRAMVASAETQGISLAKETALAAAAAASIPVATPAGNK